MKHAEQWSSTLMEMRQNAARIRDMKARSIAGWTQPKADALSDALTLVGNAEFLPAEIQTMFKAQ